MLADVHCYSITNIGAKNRREKEWFLCIKNAVAFTSIFTYMNTRCDIMSDGKRPGNHLCVPCVWFLNTLLYLHILSVGIKYIIKIRNRIEGEGQWGCGHLRIGIFEKLVTLEISKNSLYKAIFSSFLNILCMIIHFYAIKSSFFGKMDDFWLNHPNFSNFRRMRR